MSVSDVRCWRIDRDRHRPPRIPDSGNMTGGPSKARTMRLEPIVDNLPGVAVDRPIQGPMPCAGFHPVSKTCPPFNAKMWRAGSACRDRFGEKHGVRTPTAHRDEDSEPGVTHRGRVALERRDGVATPLPLVRKPTAKSAGSGKNRILRRIPARRACRPATPTAPARFSGLHPASAAGSATTGVAHRGAFWLFECERLPGLAVTAPACHLSGLAGEVAPQRMALSPDPGAIPRWRRIAPDRSGSYHLCRHGRPWAP